MACALYSGTAGDAICEQQDDLGVSPGRRQRRHWSVSGTPETSMLLCMMFWCPGDADSGSGLAEDGSDFAGTQVT